jgi:hypothetical protein
MDEDQLRPLFDTCGEIYDFTIIRNKHTKAHRGASFFVARAHRLRLCDVRDEGGCLHCDRALPRQGHAASRASSRVATLQMVNTLQVKPADGELGVLRARRDAADYSLLVSHLGPTDTEASLRRLFSPLGPLESLRLVGARSALVRFVARSSALHAIDELSGRHVRPVRGGWRE